METTAHLAQTVEALVARVALLEDHLAITRIMTSYGPAVDSGSAAVAAGLWVEEGVYDAQIVRFESAAEIADMVSRDPHQGFIHSGAAHIVSPPRIEVDGDRASATCYQLVVFRDEPADGYRIWRLSANRWDFQRRPEGWRVTTRVNRPLDGNEDARALLARAFRGSAM